MMHEQGCNAEGRAGRRWTKSEADESVAPRADGGAGGENEENYEKTSREQVVTYMFLQRASNAGETLARPMPPPTKSV